MLFKITKFKESDHQIHKITVSKIACVLNLSIVAQEPHHT